MNISGVKIHNISNKEALEKASSFFHSAKQCKIFTPNPEMIVDSQKDKIFKEILNCGDINICDGRGIQLVSKERIERITGTDLFLDLCRLAVDKKKSVYFLGSSTDTLEKARMELKKSLPELNISGMNSGPIFRLVDGEMKEISGITNAEVLQDIQDKKPDILFVAFGHNKQERWIYDNLSKIPSVKIAIGIGGAFDYISGRFKRAPKWMRQIGLEWLYRLIQEPKRIMRIFKATFVFIYLVIFKNK